jgi:hypothetical protein
MKTRNLAAVAAILMVNQLAFADASFQSTTQITGGTLVDTLKQVSFISKNLKEMLAPTSTLTMVHGNQKAEIDKDSTTITDLDKETITHIDNLKKTYTVTTFAEMRQAFQQMPAQMAKMETQMEQAQPQGKPLPPSDVKTSFDVKVNNTGVTKVVNGLNAQEQVIILTMHVTMVTPPPATGQHPADPNAPTSIDYTITTDTWVAPDPPEIKEVHDFDIRFGQKLMEGVDVKAFAAQFKQMQEGGNAAMAQLLGGKPGATDAMKQMAEEIAKLKGTRVLEVTSMGGLGGPGSPAIATGNPPAMPNGQTIAGQVASDTANQTASGEVARESGKMGIFGNALTNSALSAFHRRKSTPPTPSPTPVSTTPAAPGTPGGPANQTTVLMSTTTQKTNFSQQPIPGTAFQIPAGFKKVDNPMLQHADK